MTEDPVEFPKKKWGTKKNQELNERERFKKTELSHKAKEGGIK